MQASCTFRVSRIVAICVLLVATELVVSRSNGQTVGSAPDMPAPAAPQQDATPLPPVDASPLAPAPQLAAVTADSSSNAASPATVNGSVVPLQELDLNYSQPWAYTPAPSASPYVPTYNPSWPPAGGTTTFLMGSPLIPCDPWNVPARWVPARGLHHLRR
jgi:hypothetical protein